MNEPIIALRPAVEADKNFIYATWLRGLYHGNSWFNLIDQDIYYHSYQAVLDRLFQRPGLHCQMACLAADPDVVLGYCVFEGPIVHYVFCKKVWRGIGLMKKLLPEHFTQVSHLTETGRAILEKNYPQVIFNPFL